MTRGEADGDDELAAAPQLGEDDGERELEIDAKPPAQPGLLGVMFFAAAAGLVAVLTVVGAAAYLVMR